MFLLLNRVIYRYRILIDKGLKYGNYGSVNYSNLCKLLEKIVLNDILNDENYRFFIYIL